jgi:hypothetical protein
MDDDAILHDVQEALASALMKHERSMLGAWVVVAATTDEDGNRGVWALAAADNLRYETLGLLHDALTRDMGDGDDEDDD